MKRIAAFVLLACTAGQSVQAAGLSDDECTRLGDLAEHLQDMHERGFPLDPVYMAISGDAQTSLDLKLLQLEMARWVFANSTMSSRKVREKVEEKCGYGSFPWQ